MTQREYCELSDLQVDQCHHCRYHLPNLGPAMPDLFDDEIEED